MGLSRRRVIARHARSRLILARSIARAGADGYVKASRLAEMVACPSFPKSRPSAAGLEPAMVGARLPAWSSAGRTCAFPFPSASPSGSRARRSTASAGGPSICSPISRRGEVLVMHLGMTGRFLVEQDGEASRARASSITSRAARRRTTMWCSSLSNGARVTYNDARRFGFMDLVPRSGIETCRHFREMGIEPLGNELSGEAIARLFAGKRTPLKAALLDQRLIAGLGNIYVCEALFRAGLHPRGRRQAPSRPDAGAPTESARRLAAVIREVLDEAVEAGGSTLRDHAQVDGTLGYFQHRFRVYDREGDPARPPAAPASVPAHRAVGPLDLLLPASASGAKRSEKHQRRKQEDRQQDRARPQHVAEKARHPDAAHSRRSPRP